MARIARAVAPGVPHHVTQRGVRRMDVFFSDADRSLAPAGQARSEERRGTKTAYYGGSMHRHRPPRLSRRGGRSAPFSTARRGIPPFGGKAEEEHRRELSTYVRKLNKSRVFGAASHRRSREHLLSAYGAPIERLCSNRGDGRLGSAPLDAGACRGAVEGEPLMNAIDISRGGRYDALESRDFRSLRDFGSLSSGGSVWP